MLRSTRDPVILPCVGGGDRGTFSESVNFGECTNKTNIYMVGRCNKILLTFLSLDGTIQKRKINLPTYWVD